MGAGKAGRQDVKVDPRFAPVVEAFQGARGVTAGMLMASYGLRVKGKIFAMLVRGKLVVKLPKARVDALVSAGKGDRFDPGHGRLMKEWVSVDEGSANWIELAKDAHRFVKNGKA
jgi:TfoX/Sxy family transcriptional regulator of competence genes